jgi:hypothetical protein
MRSSTLVSTRRVVTHRRRAVDGVEATAEMNRAMLPSSTDPGAGVLKTIRVRVRPQVYTCILIG